MIWFLNFHINLQCLIVVQQVELSFKTGTMWAVVENDCCPACVLQQSERTILKLFAYL